MFPGSLPPLPTRHFAMSIIKVLLTVYTSTLTYWSFLFLYFFCTFFMRCESGMRSVVIIIPWIWTVWVTADVCTKDRYRPQRDSNPVPTGSESTTLPMSYPGATYISGNLRAHSDCACMVTWLGATCLCHIYCTCMILYLILKNTILFLPLSYCIWRNSFFNYLLLLRYAAN